MDYLTVKEVAEIKCCSVQYIRKLTKDDKIKSIRQLHPQLKQECYMIPLSALSEKEQQKYYRAKEKSIGFMPAASEKGIKEPVNNNRKGFEDYTESERQHIMLWNGIIKEWLQTRNQYEKKTEVDELFIAKLKLEHPDLNASVGILYRKYAAFKENDLDGMLGKRGGWNKGQSTIPEPVWQAFLWYYLDSNQPALSRCYELSKDWCAEFFPELLNGMPSCRSFDRRVKKDVAKAILIYARNGDKAMKDRCLPYIDRMYEDLHANEVWIADNHTFDIQSLDDGRIHRLYVTAFQDAKSGVIVGWNVTENPCSQSTLIALRHAIKRFGIPEMVYFDNGSEFLTHDVGGRGHRTRKDEEELPPTILQRLGIEMRNALVKNAKAKPIERTFCTLKNQFSKAFSGYCGGTILERPESLKQRIKSGELPRDFEVRDYLDTWIDGDYNMQTYAGAEAKYKGKSRIEVWNEDIAAVGVRTATDGELDLMLMRSTRYQKVKRNGVYVTVAGEKIWYTDPQITVMHLDEEVYVRYDPADYSQVRVYDKSDRYLWTWKAADVLLVDYITDKQEEIKDAMKLQRSVQKFIRDQKAGLTAGLSNEQKISMIDMTVRKSLRNKERFRIQMPTKIIPIRCNEEEARKVSGSDCCGVEIDLKKMINNAAKRKG
ncbi:MAG: Mu transposase C-terminal domain-containing protein [Oscillospiraceae bacterium]|nr:Mu transposase C-terminal domain-containing protein [Oscillospiraceae bacterium]